MARFLGKDDNVECDADILAPIAEASDEKSFASVLGKVNLILTLIVIGALGASQFFIFSIKNDTTADGLTIKT